MGMKKKLLHVLLSGALVLGSIGGYDANVYLGGLQ